MLFTKDNFRNLNDIQFSDFTNLNGYKSFLENQVATAKETITAYEAEIANCVEKLKSITTDAVDVVQVKAEEVVEVVKEEVKKAAPRKAAVKKTAPKEEEVAPEKEADSDK